MQNKIDLFEHPELIPKNVMEIFNDVEINDYNNLKDLLIKVKNLGYTFNFGLDLTPYELKKID
jgi:hypothetical protein